MEAQELEQKIAYATVLKFEGLSREKIAEKVGFSVSWLKKYVYPKYNQIKKECEILPNENIPVTNSQKITTIVLRLKVSDLKKEKREFSGWGSVELKDAHGEIVGVDGLEKIMPTYMARGSPITFGHSNRIVGKVLKWAIRNKSVKGKKIPGLWLNGRVHNHYKIDDQAWKAIQLSIERDQPVLSLGATPIGNPKIECNETECVKLYDDLQLYEFSITNIQGGSQGANPEAKIEVAKQATPKDSNIMISETVGGKMAKLKENQELPDNSEDLVNLMLSQCGACQDQYNVLIHEGKTEQEAKEILHKELVKTMSTVEEEKAKLDAELKKAEAEAEPVQKQNLENQNENQNEGASNLGELLQQMSAGIMEILNHLREKDGSKEEPMPDEASSEEAKSADSSPPALELSKEFDLKLRELAKQGGYTLTKPAKAPSATPSRDLTKGSNPKSKYATSEEIAEARSNGTLDQLSKKYGY